MDLAAGVSASLAARAGSLASKRSAAAWPCKPRGARQPGRARPAATAAAAAVAASASRAAAVSPAAAVSRAAAVAPAAAVALGSGPAAWIPSAWAAGNGASPPARRARSSIGGATRAMQEHRQSWRGCLLRCRGLPAIHALDTAHERHSFGISEAIALGNGFGNPFAWAAEISLRLTSQRPGAVQVGDGGQAEAWAGFLCRQRSSNAWP